MAIVEYQCNKCNRTKQFERNIRGVETLKSCTITQNCTGRMVQIELLENHIRPSDPDAILGVEDFEQRKALYTLKQQIPKQQWVVDHNLGCIPVVQLYDLNNEPLLQGTVTHVNENSLTIDFPNSDFTGIAQCIAYDTSPSANNVAPVPVSLTEYTQLTYDGKLTAAISDVNFTSIIPFDVSYVNNSGVTVRSIAVSSWMNNDSTWGDLSYAVIKGKKYVICTFDLPFDYTDDNCMVYFTYNGAPIPANNFLILLSGFNRTSYDKILNQIVDVSSVTQTMNQFSFVVSQNEIFCTNSTIQNLYPPIRPL